MKQPILLLHGALGSATQLEPLKKLLEEKGLTVHSLNFSSHGGQAPSSQGFGIQAFADETLAYIHQHHLAGIHVFGYSMGGYVALWLAHQHPDAIGSIVTLGTKFDWSPESAQAEIKKLNPEKIQEKVPAFAKILEKRHKPNDWKELMRTTTDMMRYLGDSPMLTLSILKTISIRILIALGDEDDMADRTFSETVASTLPNGSFALLLQTPHLLERMKLDTVATTLTRFFM
jgi:pimeloyl-ACP methyl ester carboxylesterase